MWLVIVSDIYFNPENVFKCVVSGATYINSLTLENFCANFFLFFLTMFIGIQLLGLFMETKPFISHWENFFCGYWRVYVHLWVVKSRVKFDVYTCLGWVIIGVDSTFIQSSGHDLPILNTSISSNRIIKTINFNGSCSNAFSVWMLTFISFLKGQHRLMVFLINLLAPEFYI
jgi:hypothetical protein